MKITNYEIDYKIDYPDYYPGASAAYTEYDEVIVGIGMTGSEALEDALDQLAMYEDFENLDIISDDRAGDLCAENEAYVYCELYYKMGEQS